MFRFISFLFNLFRCKSKKINKIAPRTIATYNQSNTPTSTNPIENQSETSSDPEAELEKIIHVEKQMQNLVNEIIQIKKTKATNVKKKAHKHFRKRTLRMSKSQMSKAEPGKITKLIKSPSSSVETFGRSRRSNSTTLLLRSLTIVHKRHKSMPFIFANN